MRAPVIKCLVLGVLLFFSLTSCNTEGKDTSSSNSVSGADTIQLDTPTKESSEIEIFWRNFADWYREGNSIRHSDGDSGYATRKYIHDSKFLSKALKDSMELYYSKNAGGMDFSVGEILFAVRENKDSLITHYKWQDMAFFDCPQIEIVGEISSDSAAFIAELMIANMDADGVLYLKVLFNTRKNGGLS